MLKGREKLLKFALILVAAFGLYLIVAWAGYSPLDNGWTVASSVTTSVLNYSGKPGAIAVDLLFAFFGKVAVVVPFGLVVSAVYLLLFKRVGRVNRRQFSSWLIGFALLMIGLSGLFSVLFDNTPYYLAGGFVGGMLNEWIGAMSGQIGVLLVAMIFTSVGFYLCSAQILIQLFNRFYQWVFEANPEGLLQKNPLSAPLVEQESSTVAAVGSPITPLVMASEPEIKEDMAIPDMPKSDVDEANVSVSLSTPEQVVRPIIHGLHTPAAAVEQTAEQPAQVATGLFDVSSLMSDKPTLPTVQIAAPESQPLNPPPVATVTPIAVSIPVEAAPLPKLSIPAIPVAPATPEQSSPELPTLTTQTSQIMPTVRLNPTKSSEAVQSQPFSAEPDIAPSVPNVAATAIEAVEVARQAVEIKVENAKQAQNVASDVPPSQEIEPDTPSVSLNTAAAAPKPTAYPKSYGNHLIHPLLQPNSVQEKPTTPLPTLDLLTQNSRESQLVSEQEIRETSARIEQELANFGVKATVEDVLVGPVVTRYEIKPAAGVKASKITNLDSDLARALIFKAIRITDVVPGKPYMGIETPNKQRETVWLRDVLASDEFQHTQARLPMALGKDISGNPVVVDMEKMPHLLVAGQTGGGKSVGINTMILSLLYKLTPDQLRFIMIDPKVVELSIYNDIPHLLTPVVTDVKKAENALRWAVEEMGRRFNLINTLSVRNIDGYNDKIRQAEEMNYPIPNPLWRPGDTMDALPPPLERMSYIVVVVDEFADLMMTAGKQVEEYIMRIAQKARAVGIHLILATQRPSTDVITGVIKANIPSRIAFTVASQIDSRTILDKGGAESLLGRGDMLYSGSGSPEIIRVHGAFMTDDDVQRVADNWRARAKPNYIEQIVESEDEVEGSGNRTLGERDPLFDAAVEYLLEGGATSITSIQRKFGLGFPRAAKIIDQLEAEGILSAPDSRGKRELLAR